MLQVMAGYDASDPTTSHLPVADLLAPLTGDLGGLRLGVDRSLLERPGVDPAVAVWYEAALDAMVGAGARVVEITIPHFDALVAATMLGWPAEALANHRKDLHERWGDYGRPTRLAIAAGTLLSAGDFVQAQRVRRVGTEAIAALLRESCDVIVTPTAAGGAPPVEGLDLATIVGAVFTPVWNAVGFPALSVPMGSTDDGLPLGLQVAALPFADGTVLKVGDAFQRLTEHHLRQPELVSA
jgi:aspartyl-tRNA(Asn)/glutamyl-tRNA(Gln) amidotransferase subunit A